MYCYYTLVLYLRCLSKMYLKCLYIVILVCNCLYLGTCGNKVPLNHRFVPQTQCVSHLSSDVLQKRSHWSYPAQSFKSHRRQGCIRLYPSSSTQEHWMHHLLLHLQPYRQAASEALLWAYLLPGLSAETRYHAKWAEMGPLPPVPAEYPVPSRWCLHAWTGLGHLFVS